MRHIMRLWMQRMNCELCNYWDMGYVNMILHLYRIRKPRAEKSRRIIMKFGYVEIFGIDFILTDAELIARMIYVTFLQSLIGRRGGK